MSTAVCTVMCSEPMIFAPASGFLPLILGAQRHQAGHLLLGEADLLAAELGQRQVGHLERGAVERGGERRDGVVVAMRPVSVVSGESV